LPKPPVRWSPLRGQIFASCSPIFAFVAFVLRHLHVDTNRVIRFGCDPFAGLPVEDRDEKGTHVEQGSINAFLVMGDLDWQFECSICSETRRWC
jgi:hypothetical protein